MSRFPLNCAMELNMATIIERPVVEKETVVERPVERETIVQGDGGSGAALLGGILIAIILAVVFFWIFAGGTGGNSSVSIEVPKLDTTTK
jgi:hypothetical protein